MNNCLIRLKWPGGDELWYRKYGKRLSTRRWTDSCPGFSACGVQEIVDKAGVPKGSFYNYFKAKELLAAEVLEIYAKASRR